MFPVSVESPVFLVLAEGATLQQRNNARGHLFEAFMARVLALHGFGEPRREDLQITSHGIELDIRATNKLTKQQAIAECKAYESPVPASKLNEFLGKLTTYRFSHSAAFGWFVALPRLSPNAQETADEIAAHDANFAVLTASSIVETLRDHGLLPSPPPLTNRLSDLAVVLTKYGLFGAAKELDANTRLPIPVRTWAADGQAPDQVVAMLAGTDFAGGYPVLAHGGSSARRRGVSEPTVVQVTGSSSDFEYQLPASPEYFVGRDDVVAKLNQLARSAPNSGTAVVVNAQSGWGKSSIALKFREVTEANGGVAIAVDSRTASTPEYVWSVLRQIAVDAAARYSDAGYRFNHPEQEAAYG